MFSKLAGNFAPIEGAGSVLPLSIAARLTLWQAVCGSLLLVVATALLYWTLESSLNRDDDDFLSGRMQVLVPMLAGSAESPTEIAEEIARESGSRNPFRLYIRLLNGEGAVIGETSGMAEVLPARLFSRAPGLGSAGIEPFDLNSASGRPFRAASTAVPATDATRIRIIQMAIDRTEDEALLRLYRNRMGAVLMIGLLLFALTTWFITRRGMRVRFPWFAAMFFTHPHVVSQRRGLFFFVEGGSKKLASAVHPTTLCKIQGIFYSLFCGARLHCVVNSHEFHLRRDLRWHQ